MAIIKRAKNMTVHIKGTHTIICGGEYRETAKSITVTSTKEDLILASNKKVIVNGEQGGVQFREYIPLSPNIVNVKWMDENQEKEIDHVDINQTVFLYVETDEKREGTDVSISVTTSDNSEVILNGTTEDAGIAKIEWVYV